MIKTIRYCDVSGKEGALPVAYKTGQYQIDPVDSKRDYERLEIDLGHEAAVAALQYIVDHLAKEAWSLDYMVQYFNNKRKK